MAIRLRRVEGVGLIAICAARSVPKEGDVYLDDAAHHALSVKFDLDIASMYREHRAVYAGSDEAAAMEREESNNVNREWWDREYSDLSWERKDA